MSGTGAEDDFLVRVTDIPGSVEYHLGLPRLQWAAMFEYLHSNFGHEQGGRAMVDVFETWLELLAEELGDYTVSDSEHFVLLHRRGEPAEPTLKLAEMVRKGLIELLGNEDEPWLLTLLHILAIAGAEHRVAYIDYFWGGDDDAEHAEHSGPLAEAPADGDEIQMPEPSGVIVDDLVPHILVAPTSVYDMLPYLLAEAALYDHTDLPFWVRVGFEHYIAAAVSAGEFTFSDPAARAELALRMIASREAHIEHWRQHTIEAFLAGDAFGGAEDGSDETLARDLAEGVVGMIATSYPRERFTAFLRDAREDDGGEAAARQHLGTSVHDIVHAFFGDGSRTRK